MPFPANVLVIFPWGQEEGYFRKQQGRGEKRYVKSVYLLYMGAR